MLHEMQIVLSIFAFSFFLYYTQAPSWITIYMHKYYLLKHTQYTISNTNTITVHTNFYINDYIYLNIRNSCNTTKTTANRQQHQQVIYKRKSEEKLRK